LARGERSGTVSKSTSVKGSVATDAEAVGRSAILLGAGRAVKDDIIDPTAGILFKKQVGDRVKAGETLAILLTSDKENRFSDSAALLRSALTVKKTPPPTRPTVLDIIRS
jgi:pyrimidine-nucleoside phosphorylase